MKRFYFFFFCWLNAFILSAQTTFQVKISPALHAQTLDGRLLLLISKNDSSEPRFQIQDGHATQQVFGQDVENWKSGAAITMSNASTYGYPIEKWAQFPAGEYTVQVLLHKYETFKRKDGFTVKMPMDRGEGQQ